METWQVTHLLKQEWIKILGGIVYVWYGGYTRTWDFIHPNRLRIIRVRRIRYKNKCRVYRKMRRRNMLNVVRARWRKS